MADDRDPKIEPLEYLSGVKVVDIGEMRVARGMTRRPYSACRHRQLHYDANERRIWCADCETNVEAFDAFKLIVEYFSEAESRLSRRQQEIAEAEQFQVRSLAAKVIDEAWRSRKMVPACPHCRQGLFPEDFKNGVGLSLGREYAQARRKKAQEAKT